MSTTTVTGVAVRANGQPAAGVTVTATLSEPISVGGVEISRLVYAAETSATGAWSLALPVTADPSVTPQGAYYTITEPVSGLNVSVGVTASPVPVDVTQLPVIATANSGVTSFNGRTGAVLLEASDVTGAGITNIVVGTPSSASKTFTQGTGTAFAQAPNTAKMYFVSYYLPMFFNPNQGGNLEIQVGVAPTSGWGSAIVVGFGRWQAAADTGAPNSLAALYAFTGGFFLPAGYYFAIEDQSSAPTADYLPSAATFYYQPLD